MATEIQDLKARVLAADLSIANPRMQQIYQNELERWVESYEYKKTAFMADCYGSPGQIPDSIDVGGKRYSPHEILAHVKARDDVGMTVLKQMERSADSNEFGAKNIVKNVVESFSDDIVLDEVFMGCACGAHQLTYRRALEGLANVDPEIRFFKGALPDAVLSLYGQTMMSVRSRRSQ